jgi:acylphosphatase
MENIRVHLFVSGRVQGVFFRAGAQKEARNLGVKGWAHNLADGTVEIVAEGEKEKVERFVAWCRKGTLFAKVEHVEIAYGIYRGEFDEFSIREFGF